MLPILSKSFRFCLVSLLILVTCVSCKARPPYKVATYLNDLAISSGIASKEDDYFDKLLAWKVIDENDKEDLDKELDYEFVIKTINNITDKDIDFDYLKSRGWIENDIKLNDKVDQEKAISIIDKIVNYINNPEIEEKYEYIYQDNVVSDNDDLKIGDIYLDEDEYYLVIDKNELGIVRRKAEIEDVYSKLYIEKEFEIDFTDSEITTYGSSENSSYINNYYNLLSNKKETFNYKGYRISYSVNASGIDVHISKKVNDNNIYLDLSVNNVKPVFKWDFIDGDFKNCFFNVTFNSSEKLGVSNTKYSDMHLKFKDLDKSSFTSLLRSMVIQSDDDLIDSITICKIKTPIPNIPSASIIMDLRVNFYVSGKVELQLYNNHSLGFETKDGNIRYINEHHNDFDGILSASSKVALGLNIGLKAASFDLADIEIDGGLQAKLNSTMHLYDDEGQLESQNSNLAYSTLQDLSKDNENVKICADISLNWLSDIIINTAKTKMNKLGFTKTFKILDEKAQLFNNLTHIENGHFVKKCSRNNKEKLQQMSNVISNKIVLDSYAEVLHLKDSYQIIIKSLPKGYEINNLIYSSNNPDIATVSGGLISAISSGSAQIKVETSDKQYSAYVNILVSDS